MPDPDLYAAAIANARQVALLCLDAVDDEAPVQEQSLLALCMAHANLLVTLLFLLQHIGNPPDPD